MPHHHHDKFSDATTVAAFNSQFEAEDALLGLRAAGFNDRQIGYYCLQANGLMQDNLATYRRLSAVLLWGAIGVGAGVLVSWMLYLSGVDWDQWGIRITCGVFGALLLGLIGGTAGLRRPERGTYIALPEGMAEPFVMAVNAGPATPTASTILHQHGGHAVEIRGYTALAS